MNLKEATLQPTIHEHILQEADFDRTAKVLDLFLDVGKSDFDVRSATSTAWEVSPSIRYWIHSPPGRYYSM